MPEPAAGAAPTLRLLVTRPGAQAVDWVLALAAHGLDAVALPLIGIEAVDDPAPLRAAWAALADCRLVVFVSPNAATQFFAQRPAGVVWPAGTLAGSPGPGTSRVLRALGVPADAIAEPSADAPQFDSESLWAALRGHDWAGRRVLVVRGESGRDWLAQTLQSAGATVDFLTAYRRAAPRLDATQAALLAEALARPAAHLWLFSSSEAIGHLQALAPSADWSAARALATHPRIAATARAAGFGAVHECPPALGDVIACIQSIGPRDLERP